MYISTLYIFQFNYNDRCLMFYDRHGAHFSSAHERKIDQFTSGRAAMVADFQWHLSSFG